MVEMMDNPLSTLMPRRKAANASSSASPPLHTKVSLGRHLVVNDLFSIPFDDGGRTANVGDAALANAATASGHLLTLNDGKPDAATSAPDEMGDNPLRRNITTRRDTAVQDGAKENWFPLMVEPPTFELLRDRRCADPPTHEFIVPNHGAGDEDEGDAEIDYHDNAHLFACDDAGVDAGAGANDHEEEVAAHEYQNVDNTPWEGAVLQGPREYGNAPSNTVLTDNAAAAAAAAAAASVVGGTLQEHSILEEVLVHEDEDAHDYQNDDNKPWVGAVMQGPRSYENAPNTTVLKGNASAGASISQEYSTLEEVLTSNTDASAVGSTSQEYSTLEEVLINESSGADGDAGEEDEDAHDYQNDDNRPWVGAVMQGPRDYENAPSTTVPTGNAAAAAASASRVDAGAAAGTAAVSVDAGGSDASEEYSTLEEAIVNEDEMVANIAAPHTNGPAGSTAALVCAQPVGDVGSSADAPTSPPPFVRGKWNHELAQYDPPMPPPGGGLIYYSEIRDEDGDEGASVYAAPAEEDGAALYVSPVEGAVDGPVDYAVPDEDGGAVYAPPVDPIQMQSHETGLSCTRPSPAGGTCKHMQQRGSRFCSGHSCTVAGCGESKSQRAATCPLHAAADPGEEAGRC
jgi:hypothetical protein